MNISEYSIITKSDNPYAQAGRVQSGGEGRQRARTFAEESQPQRQQAQSNAKAVPAAEKSRAVVPVSNVYTRQQRADYYQVEDVSRFTSTQRKALQLYSANKGLSMLDANADFLGAVDTFA